MGKGSKISWTHHTFNPWWGCTKVSPGCVHCYAEGLSKRTGNEVWGDDKGRRFFGDKHWAEPLRWNEAALEVGERHQVFCASMADVFEDRGDLHEPRARLFKLIEDTPNLDWLLLTKRPENMTRLAPTSWLNVWPKNAWAMTSVENQVQAHKRIPELLKVPAQIRGLSVEPLLEEVTLGLMGICPSSWGKGYNHVGDFIHWVIVGGESGPGFRPFEQAWAEKLLTECTEAGIAFFMKQFGGFPNKRDDITEFPPQLHVQEWPGGR